MVKRDVYITEKDYGWIAMSEEILKSQTNYVTIGVHAEDAPREAVRSPSEAAISNVDAAVLNEFGATLETSDGRVIEIPPRPFMEVALLKNWNYYLKMMAKLGERTLMEDGYTHEMALEWIGQTVKKDIKDNITDDIFEPLAAATIKKRQKKGQSSITPLFDTKQLHDSIKHKVVT